MYKINVPYRCSSFKSFYHILMELKLFEYVPNIKLSHILLLLV